MRKLNLRPSAQEDLKQIYTYIAERSGDPVRAMNYIQRIRQSLKVLLIFPESGRLRNDLRPGLRIFGFERRVVIAYAILDNGDIEIGRFLYGGQDYDTLLSTPDEP